MRRMETRETERAIPPGDPQSLTRQTPPRAWGQAPQRPHLFVRLGYDLEAA